MKLLFYLSPSYLNLLLSGVTGAMVFNTTFNNISVLSLWSMFTGGGNRSTRRKPPICHTFRARTYNSDIFLETQTLIIHLLKEMSFKLNYIYIILIFLYFIMCLIYIYLFIYLFVCIYLK